MTSRNKVQNTHISAQLRHLHGALLDIVAVMNRPQRDEALIKAAGIPLDRALFPLLVCVERFGPIGVVDLAGRIGRDYTTISRQVAKLESLGLVARRDNNADRRVRDAIVTPQGKAMTDRVDTARDRIGRVIFESWRAQDIADLVRLMRKFADALNDGAPKDA
jgi:DNA-binding MarR family transcriptional regulator